MSCRYSSCRSFSSPNIRSSSTSEKPITAFSGRTQLVRHVGQELGLVLARHLQLARLPPAPGTGARCGSPPPTGSRTSPAARRSPAGTRRAPRGGRPARRGCSSSRSSGTASIERHPWRRSASTWGSGGSASRSGACCTSPRAAACPMNVSSSRIAHLAQPLDELPAACRTSAQLELSRRRLVLRGRTAVCVPTAQPLV